MSADGEIEIAVSAEGADDAAAELADGEGDGGGPPSPTGDDGGGGAVSDFTKGGIIGGLLGSLDSIIKILDPILKILNTFLAPLAVLLLRLLQPVLRVLVGQVLPLWLSFMDFLIDAVGNIYSFISGLLPGLLAAVAVLPALIWAAFSSGAAWLVNGAANIGRSVWGLIKSGASWIVNGAANIGSAAWGFIKQGFNWITESLAGLPREIWDFMKRLPGQIASAIGGAVPGLASGGVVTSPTLATVGEAGDEAVIPLDRLEQMLGRQREGETTVQIGGGLAPFVQEVERSSQVDL